MFSLNFEPYEYFGDKDSARAGVMIESYSLDVIDEYFTDLEGVPKTERESLREQCCTLYFKNTANVGKARVSCYSNDYACGYLYLYLDIDEYWKDSFDRRGSRYWNVCRMEDVFWSYYLKNKDTDAYGPFDDPINYFEKSKRPFGYKYSKDSDLAMAVAYHLGWDWMRLLCGCCTLPEYMVNEAIEILSEVKNTLKKESLYKKEY